MTALEDETTTTQLSRGVSIVRVDWFRRNPGGGGTVHREATSFDVESTLTSASATAGRIPLPPVDEGR